MSVVHILNEKGKCLQIKQNPAHIWSIQECCTINLLILISYISIFRNMCTVIFLLSLTFSIINQLMEFITRYFWIIIYRYCKVFVFHYQEGIKKNYCRINTVILRICIVQCCHRKLRKKHQILHFRKFSFQFFH